MRKVEKRENWNKLDELCFMIERNAECIFGDDLGWKSSRAYVILTSIHLE